MKSAEAFLECPSAMFEGIETDARLIWLVKPNCSAAGKFAVTLYTSVTNATDFYQTSSSLWFIS